MTKVQGKFPEIDTIFIPIAKGATRGRLDVFKSFLPPVQNFADHTSSTKSCCCSCCRTVLFQNSKMVGSFSRAFGGCRSNFARMRGSQANFTFNGAKPRPRGKVS